MTTEAATAPGIDGEAADDVATIAAKKRLALTYLNEAWEEAIAEGVDPEIVAHAALFTALCDLIATYGEEAVAELAESLPSRIRDLEFTVDQRTVQ
jgi:hypothetical protein